MERIRIAIDPAIWIPYGPEVRWILRSLFVSLGYPWQLVRPDSDSCDLAYWCSEASAPRCRILVCADVNRWSRRDQVEFANAVEVDGLMAFRFSGESEPAGVAVNHAGAILVRHDFIFDAFWLASGLAEIGWSKRRFGFFQMDGSHLYRAGVFMRAPVSAFGTWLQRQLEPHMGPPPFPRWPRGARCVACASHDVDYPEVKRLIEPLRLIARLGARGFVPALEVLIGRRDHWHFGSWTAIEKEIGLRSAFYFVARPGSLVDYALGTPDPFYDVQTPKFRVLLSNLTRDGFEVGLQASYFAYQSLDKFLSEKRIIEEVAQSPIHGNRHHYWHLNPVDPEETLIIHEQADLLYDTSLGFEHCAGWRRGIVWPFFPYSHRLRRPVRTLQIQTVWMDDQLFGHADYNRPDASSVLNALVETMIEQGGVFLADMHEYVFDRVLFPNWSDTYVGLFRSLSSRGDIYLDRPVNVARHWIYREARISNISEGL